MTCSFMRLAMLHFETKLQKCIRFGINVIKIFILGGTSSDMRLEITFYGSALKHIFATLKIRDEGVIYIYQ